MDLLGAIQSRHSVRSYTDKKIEGEVEKQLRIAINECNRKSGLRIQLFLNEPKAFGGMMARYGKFSNVQNYIALVGKKDKEFEAKCGYYGEKIVIRATQLGLQTCWVGLTYSKGKSAIIVEKGEKLLMVIAIGYGENLGVPHKTKEVEALCQVSGNMPKWFSKGMESVQLAPTAMNQQKFRFILEGNTVEAKALTGFYAKVDLGIVKYHFEVGAGKSKWKWKMQ